MEEGKSTTERIKGWDAYFQKGEHGRVYEALKRKVVSFSRILPSGAKILDLGCGNGKYSAILTNLGHNVTGVDFSAEAVQWAKKKYPKCTFFNRSMTKFRAKGMDAIVCINSYHCLTTEERKVLVRNVQNSLNEGGYLFLTALSREDSSYPRDSWIKQGENTYVDQNRLYHFFSEGELRLELAALRIVKFESLRKEKSKGRESVLFVVTARKQKQYPSR